MILKQAFCHQCCHFNRSSSAGQNHRMEAVGRISGDHLAQPHIRSGLPRSGCSGIHGDGLGRSSERTAQPL